MELRVPIINVGMPLPSDGLFMRPPPCKIGPEIILALYARHFESIFEIDAYDEEKDDFFVKYDFAMSNQQPRHLSSSSESESDDN